MRVFTREGKTSLSPLCQKKISDRKFETRINGGQDHKARLLACRLSLPSLGTGKCQEILCRAFVEAALTEPIQIGDPLPTMISAGGACTLKSKSAGKMWSHDLVFYKRHQGPRVYCSIALSSAGVDCRSSWRRHVSKSPEIEKSLKASRTF